jgi:hypothetical protein
MRSSIQIGDPTRTTTVLALITAAYFALSLIEIIGKPRSILDEVRHLHICSLFDIFVI